MVRRSRRPRPTRAEQDRKRRNLAAMRRVYEAAVRQRLAEEATGNG